MVTVAAWGAAKKKKQNRAGEGKEEGDPGEKRENREDS